jgi:hypothetical protein
MGLHDLLMNQRIFTEDNRGLTSDRYGQTLRLLHALYGLKEAL